MDNEPSTISNSFLQSIHETSPVYNVESKVIFETNDSKDNILNSGESLEENSKDFISSKS